MKAAILLMLSVFLMNSLASAQQKRVPRIFTGNSPAPAYKNFPLYRDKKDSRASTGRAEYYFNPSKLKRVRRREGVQSVHTMVRNIAKDGLCGKYKECFRVYIFVNGDENGGHHIATFVVSPGTGSRTPETKNGRLRRYTRNLTSFERPTQNGKFDMYRIYGSKSYPDPRPNMPNAMFYLSAIALHGSFGKVNGTKQSHGCIRMNPDESYWLHSLVKESGGNMTVDVYHTR